MSDKMIRLDGRTIAELALGIGAITLNPTEPYTWASGYRMPIYNDNRKHLAYPENRKLITSAFIEIIEENNMEPDLIAGTMTAGIAPAASLAQYMELPLAILDKDKIQYFPIDFFQEQRDRILIHGADIIISTCPTAIVAGVVTANVHNLPFAYVRSKGKDHGLKQQIEGIVKGGQKAVFIDYFTDESYRDKAIGALEEKGVEVVDIISENIGGFVERSSESVKSKKILHIEDLVSTGGSCVDEIQTLRKMGAQITDCLAIFSYDFPETLDKFRTVACRLHPALTYNYLLEVALERNSITSEQHEILKEWRKAPFEWGEKHGFPKVEKK